MKDVIQPVNLTLLSARLFLGSSTVIVKQSLDVWSQNILSVTQHLVLLLTPWLTDL